MTDTNQLDVLEEFIATEAGQAWLEEKKTPLLNKRNELLTDLAKTKAELENIRKAEAEKAAMLKQEQIAKESSLEEFKKFHETEVNTYKNTLKEFQTKYAKEQADRLIADAATKYSRTPKPLQILLKEKVKSVITDNGEVQIQVMGDDGRQLYHNGEPATVEHLLEMMKSEEDYKPFFTNQVVSGSGTQKSETLPTGATKDMSAPSYNLTQTMAKTRK